MVKIVAQQKRKVEKKLYLWAVFEISTQTI